MSAKQKLKRALSAIDDARTALARAKRESPDGATKIRTALSELDDAASYIERAIRELPSD